MENLMKIDVRLFGVFRIDRFEQELREYPAGTTAGDVVKDLGLSEKLLGVVVVNGVHASEDHPLKDGDSLTLLPLLDGG